MNPGSSSATAELIAQGLVFLSRDPRLGRLVPVGAAELSERFLSASAPGRLWLIRLATHPVLRQLVQALERRVLPGILLHYALRKRFIEDAARAFLEGAGGQLVVVGAGLDTLASRIAAAHPGVSCIEVDHPATQEKKRRALADGAPKNLALVPADLGRVGIGEALAQAPLFSVGGRTFFVLEGVSMYLTESVVAETLGDFGRLGGSGTQVAWTFMVPDADGRIAFRRSRKGAVDAWLRAKGEPFKWGISRERVQFFLQPLGLTVRDLASAAVLRARYQQEVDQDEPLAEGEECCLCQKT